MFLGQQKMILSSKELLETQFDPASLDDEGSWLLSHFDFYYSLFIWSIF